jgi:hypothetical protein
MHSSSRSLSRSPTAQVKTAKYTVGRNHPNKTRFFWSRDAGKTLKTTPYSFFAPKICIFFFSVSALREGNFVGCSGEKILGQQPNQQLLARGFLGLIWGCCFSTRPEEEKKKFRGPTTRNLPVSIGGNTSTALVSELEHWRRIPYAIHTNFVLYQHPSWTDWRVNVLSMDKRIRCLIWGS